MQRLIKALVFGFAASVAAMPAAAQITVIPGNMPQPDQTNLLSTGGTGNPVTGVTDPLAFQVTILGTENLTLPAAGLQATVGAGDGGLNTLTFSLADPNSGFASLILNLDALQDGFVSFSDGGSVTSLFALDDNGFNFFTLTNGGGPLFTSLSFTSTVDILQVSQIRLGGIAALNDIPGVPEPETWSYMLLGFGLAGLVLRKGKPREPSRQLDLRHT